ncbi:uncharacterized protein LOC106133614 [Amyelois transitella]|uniref:uncharacterized protein LOC106133614 n=1 Tax=Amyelois transitella TaxID=680683 RepID=UPI00298F7210|nr:uncharacterized protein LOC106133614 [Amyelois transitella]
MTSSYDDSVMNFDLGFLHQTNKNSTGIGRLEKQRKAIIIAKQKTITTDGLIRKYYDKKEILEQTERTLLASKEECKKICIDYKNILEKCERLENEVQVIQHYNQQLQQKLSNSENQFCGIQSHVRQLEELVKEQETKIDSLKIENHLEKSNIKNFAASNSTLQKQNDELLQDLCILGKFLIGNKKLKPVHEAVLQKYEKYLRHDVDSCNDSGRDDTDNELDLFDDNSTSPPSPQSPGKSKHQSQSSSVDVQEVIVVNLDTTGRNEPSISKPNEFDGNSVSSNELASADTGRGSSLAFSDSEKCFRSPDYLTNDNHSSPESTNTINVNSVGTSPMHDYAEHIDDATRPIDSETLTIPILAEKGDVSVNGIGNIPNSSETCTRKSMVDTFIDSDPNNQLSCLHRGYLPVNSSNHENDDNSRDCEVELILSEMHFNHDLVTPIPSSPCSSRSTVSSKVSGCQTDHSDFVICSDAAKLRQENKILHDNIADLAKEIVNIKNILKMNPSTFIENHQEVEIEPNHEKEYSDEIIDPDSRTEINTVDKRRERCNEIDTENDDLIDIVDLIQISGPECLEIHDFSDKEGQKAVKNCDDTNNSCEQTGLQEGPIVIMEEQENAPEGIMSRLEFEEDTILSPVQAQIGNLNDLNSISEANAEGDSIEKLFNSKGMIKRLRKLNSLEKLRRKMVPKCKIRREKSIKRSHRKQIGRSIRQIRLQVSKKKITSADSSASLNDKTIYNNAVRVMTELKSKQVGESVNRTVFKTKRSPKQQIEKSLNLSKVDDSPTPGKKQLSNLFKISYKPTEKLLEKPFDVSDLIAKQTPRPVVKSVLASQEIQRYIHNDEKKTEQSLKLMQPIICVDKLLDNKNVEHEFKCVDKTSHIGNMRSPQTSPSVTTRSRSRIEATPQKLYHESNTEVESTLNNTLDILPKEGRKRLRCVASDENQEVEHKRILRSSTRHPNSDNFNTKLINNAMNIDNKRQANSQKGNMTSKNEDNVPLIDLIHKKSDHTSSISYDDLDMFDEGVPKRANNCAGATEAAHKRPKDSILCSMLNKYSLCKLNFYPKKIPDGITNTIYKLLDDSIKHINELPPDETKTGMDDLVENLQSWNVKQFLSGFMKYLQEPQRKVELYSKVNSPPAPPMTKTEQILIYIILQLKEIWSTVDVVNYILNSIEFIMFKLNRTPEFDTIESMSHFYAILCRYFKMKTRLRLFMLDAMYCMQYKAITLIRQCMDVWMHILPLAHMGIAKNPLVTCVVYLLHFYKCEDHFNRVQDIRNILYRKYSYQMSEWNEAKILEMFRSAIYELRDIPVEKKMLRLSLVIIAKRQGARWCQKNIITNLLQPIIEKKNSPSVAKQFCISMLGPLLKPFPADMKVHCEIVMNLLIDMTKQKSSQSMEEAIFTSLIYMSKHNHYRVISALLSWHPKKISQECHEILRDFVRDKPANAWKAILSKVNLNRDTKYRTDDSDLPLKV